MKTTIHQAYPPKQTTFSAPEIGTHDTLYEENDLSSQHNSQLVNQDSQDQAQKGNSSLMTVAFNIINTAIGGGILGYPYILRQMGIVTGVLMIIIGAILTCFSASILLKVKNLCGVSEYTGIAQACFKKFGRVLAEVIIVVNTLGGCIIYLVVFTTVVQNLLEAFVNTCNPDRGSISFYCRPSLITTFGALIVLPFNFMKDMGKLKVIGILKVLSIFLFTGITIAFALHKAIMGELDSDVNMFPNFQEPVAMLASIPQIIFGFNFLYNQFSLYNSMKDPQDSKFNKTTISSMTFVGLVYIAVGVCGYLIYGSSTDNMLKNFTKEDLGAIWFCVLNAAFLVCSLGGIPVTFFPAREILYESIMKGLTKRKSHDDYTRLVDNRSINLSESRSLPAQSQKNKKVFVSIVLITNILVILVAIVAPGLNQVLGVIGSIGSSSLMFLFPMAFYLFLTRGKENSKVLPIIIIAFGIVVAISGFITNLMKMISS